MINKEDFLKKFPLKKKYCVVDYNVSERCVLDDDRSYDCIHSDGKNGVTKKEDCKYWKDMPNWEYIEDIWNWINNYQKKGES